MCLRLSRDRQRDVCFDYMDSREECIWMMNRSPTYKSVTLKRMSWWPTRSEKSYYRFSLLSKTLNHVGEQNWFFKKKIYKTRTRWSTCVSMWLLFWNSLVTMFLDVLIKTILDHLGLKLEISFVSLCQTLKLGPKTLFLVWFWETFKFWTLGLTSWSHIVIHSGEGLVYEDHKGWHGQKYSKN